MANVYLKGFKEPVYLADDRAILLKTDFENGRLDEVVKIGETATVRKDDIKSVVLNNAPVKKINKGVCEVTNCEGKCHWLLVRNDGRAIWKQPYTTKSELLAEMNFENLHKWGKIEHKFLPQ